MTGRADRIRRFFESLEAVDWCPDPACPVGTIHFQTAMLILDEERNEFVQALNEVRELCIKEGFLDE